MSINSKALLTYTVEMRAHTNRKKRALRKTEIRALRAIAGVTLRDRLKSNEIGERCDGTPDVVRWSRGRRREWREHVDRMGNDRLTKAEDHQKDELLDFIVTGHRLKKLEKQDIVLSKGRRKLQILPTKKF